MREQPMRIPMYTAPMTCTICDHDWVAVFVLTVPGLQCPACGYMNGMPPLILPGTDAEEEGRSW